MTRIKLKSLFLNIPFVAAVLLFLVTVVINLYQNLAYSSDLTHIGTMNVLLSGLLFGPNRFLFIGPIIAVIPASRFIYDELTSGFAKQVIIRKGYRYYFSSRILWTLTEPMIIVMLSCIVTLLFSFLVSPYPSYRLQFIYKQYPFSGIYQVSLAAYFVVQLTNLCIFTASYSLFGSALFLIFQNKYIGFIVPPIFYIISSYFHGVPIYGFALFPDSSVSIMIAPTVEKLIQDHISMLLLGLVLIMISIRKWKKVAAF